MTAVPFGTPQEYATVLYDRHTQVCVIIANSSKYMPDALAIVNSMKASEVIVVAPPEVGLEYDRLVPTNTRSVYVYRK